MNRILPLLLAAVLLGLGSCGASKTPENPSTQHAALPCEAFSPESNNGTAKSMITIGKELIRINPANNHIEYSTSQGRNWSARYTGKTCGRFIDILLYGNELLAVTTKGIYYSTNQGRTWNARYTGKTCGEFRELMDGGRELLARTSKGLYYSSNQGRTWNFRNR